MKRIEIPIIERKDDIVSKKEENCSIYEYYEGITTNTLWEKYLNNIPFTINDLIYLYDIYNIKYLDQFNSFSSIIRMRKDRDKVSDMAIIFDCDSKEIASSQSELNKDPSRYVALDCGLYDVYDDIKYSRLKYIRGNLYSEIDKVIDKFPVLSSVNGDVYLSNLTSSVGLDSLRSIGGYAGFGSLKEANSLSSLEIVGGNCVFNNLLDASGLEKLKKVKGYLHFENLVSSKGLDNLKEVSCSAFFNSLVEATYLTNLEIIGGDAHFQSLKDISGLDNLKEISGLCYFDSLNNDDAEKIKKLVKSKVIR